MVSLLVLEMRHALLRYADNPSNIHDPLLPTPLCTLTAHSPDLCLYHGMLIGTGDHEDGLLIRRSLAHRLLGLTHPCWFHSEAAQAQADRSALRLQVRQHFYQLALLFHPDRSPLTDNHTCFILALLCRDILLASLDEGSLH